MSSVCAFDTANTHYLDSDMDRLGISKRGHKPPFIVEPTLVDLNPSVTINRSHLAEASFYDRVFVVRHLSPRGANSDEPSENATHSSAASI